MLWGEAWRLGLTAGRAHAMLFSDLLMQRITG